MICAFSTPQIGTYSRETVWDASIAPTMLRRAVERVADRQFDRYVLDGRSQVPICGVEECAYRCLSSSLRSSSRSAAPKCDDDKVPWTRLCVSHGTQQIVAFQDDIRSRAADLDDDPFSEDDKQ